MVRREAKDRAILTAAAVSVAASSIPIHKEVITMPDIKTRVKRTIQEQLFLKDNEIGDSDTLEELGADSLDEVELIMALEEEFEIEIADADAEKFKTVQDVVDYVTGLGIVPE